MPATIIYDILLCQEKPLPADIIETLTMQLQQKGLVVAPEKIQTQAPWTYLGWRITYSIVKLQKMEISSSVSMLNDAQKLPYSPVDWTDDHAKALQAVAEKLMMSHADRHSASHPIGVWVCNHPSFPFALLMQDFNWEKENARRSQRHREAEEIAILEWMFPPHTAPKSIWQRTEVIALLIRKGRQRCVEVDGQEPEWISVPIKAANFAWQLQHSEPIQIALIGFSGHIRHEAPRNKRLQAISQFSWVEKPIISK
ncbi:hypothetical protein WISP_36279 [Willisornis vidua]|uniref:Uncharacterized protein n=1 Tax=Willisornis vidua TaxID=1566151 RepID=A0ABQ9DIH8_9PASS|nr:hypothetical protein WISP_51986 [Willisornis vidua]KAJ7422896.1 hypothetical protein WISP_36279 [Willisornis vidua]